MATTDPHEVRRSAVRRRAAIGVVASYMRERSDRDRRRSPQPSSRYRRLTEHTVSPSGAPAASS